MPIIKLTTNLKSHLFNGEFRKNFLEILSQTLKKPAESIALELRPESNLSLGITDDSAVLLNVEAMGFISPEENIRHTHQITEFLGKNLNIEASRVLITFRKLEPYEVGKKGTTAQKQREQQKQES